MEYVTIFLDLFYDVCYLPNTVMTLSLLTVEETGCLRETLIRVISVTPLKRLHFRVGFADVSVIKTRISCQASATRCIMENVLPVMPHLHLVPPLGTTPFEFCRDFRHQKTSLPGLSSKNTGFRNVRTSSINNLTIWCFIIRFRTVSAI